MNRIALIIGDKFLYWNPILLALGILCAICMYWALAVRERDDRPAAMYAVPVAFLLSMVLSRLVHWYCRPQGYAGMLRALTDYSRGGYALVGTFIGCLLTALILRMVKVSRNLPRMLDHMAIAGSLGICVGRLAALFTTADRGMVLPDWVPFPLASRFLNTVSGETEVRLAVFMIQSIIAGILFVTMLVLYLKGKHSNTLRDGDTCLVFLLWYCASQAVLDSPRYDSLYFRSNGFVSVVQIFSILTVITILIWVTVRLFKAGQWKKVWLTVLTLPLLGLAGYMEYYVQRHGGEALFAYSVMSVSMLTAAILITVIWKKAGTGYRVQENRVYDTYDAYDPYNAYGSYAPRQDVRNPQQGYRPSQPAYQAPASSREAPHKPQRRSSGHYQGKFAAKK